MKRKKQNKEILLVIEYKVHSFDIFYQQHVTDINDVQIKEKKRGNTLQLDLIFLNLFFHRFDFF